MAIKRRQSMVAIGGKRWWTAAMNGGGWQQWMVDKVNGERINWCEVKIIIVKKYKIRGEKIGIK